MDIMGFINKNGKGLLFSLLIIVVLGGAYVFQGSLSEGGMAAAQKGENTALFGGIRLKAATTPEGVLKVFANAKVNTMAKMPVVEGDSIPDGDSVVIGFSEAQMMRKENLFAKAGDNILSFFGTDVIVGGVLQKTNTPADMFHFLDRDKFDKINGQTNRIYLKQNDKNMTKVFYVIGINEAPNSTFRLPSMEFAEGTPADYKEHEFGGETLYPLVIGSDEAKVMRDEKLFSRTGDIIRGFFGKDVIVVGVLKPTGTVIDMIHFLPLNENQLN